MWLSANMENDHGEPTAPDLIVPLILAWVALAIGLIVTGIRQRRQSR
jgi:hypothetical protein